MVTHFTMSLENSGIYQAKRVILVSTIISALTSNVYALITFDPPNALRIVLDDYLEIRANLDNATKQDVVVLQLTSLETKVASIPLDEIYFEPYERMHTFKIKGERLGLTQVEWKLYQNLKLIAIGKFDASVKRGQDNIQLIFTIFVVILISINNVNMGCLLDLETIKKVLRAPTAPIIGFCCQFLFMPLVSFETFSHF